MSNWISFIIGIGFGWWFAPAFWDISKKAWAEFVQWYQFGRHK